jgi:hypothetical protein
MLSETLTNDRDYDIRLISTYHQLITSIVIDDEKVFERLHSNVKPHELIEIDDLFLKVNIHDQKMLFRLAIMKIKEYFPKYSYYRELCEKHILGYFSSMIHYQKILDANLNLCHLIIDQLEIHVSASGLYKDMVHVTSMFSTILS